MSSLKQNTACHSTNAVETALKIPLGPNDQASAARRRCFRRGVGYMQCRAIQNLNEDDYLAGFAGPSFVMMVSA
jgi:hypothetical protein